MVEHTLVDGAPRRVERASDDELDAIFRALADRTRRALLRRLAAGEATVTELARPHAMSLAAVSKHIGVLERAGLASRTVDGRVHHLALRPDRLRTASEWVAYYQQFWSEGLERLDALLVEPPVDDASTVEGTTR
ncbi:MAG: metalloregulator ArsR/SmtB family transcription factor [Chloroflexi bacterium]|nr:metalloregulator ArsR/SmtB family transcription factor [Chloroflexota bacterium]